MNTLLRVIEIPNLIKKVTLSEKRRAKYYTKKDKIPKKYDGWGYDKKGRLVDELGTPVIRNKRTAGTPRYETINGQKLYSGLTMPFVRSTMVKQIKSFFDKYLRNVERIDPEDFPLRMTIDLYDEPKDGNWDLDNKWIYIKCLMDSLKTSNIIPDDSIRYITHSPGFKYHPIKEGESPRMVLKIYKDDRKELLETQLYNELYGNGEEW